jgi:UDP-glucose 4-epimerase
MKTVKVLITGGSGYLGRALASMFDDPVLLDRYNDFNDDRLLTVDLLNFNDLQEAVVRSNPDVVVHLAASKSVTESRENPSAYYQNNIASSLNIIKLCEELDLPIVFASTAAVYLPETPYSDSKLFIEKVLSKTRLNYRILRYFNIGGLVEPPTSRQKGNVFDILRGCANKEIPFTLNSNSLPRDYTHILDVAGVTAEVVAEVYSEGGCKTYDVLSGISCSLYDLIDEYRLNGVNFQIQTSNDLVEVSNPVPENSYPFTPRYSIADIVKSEIQHGLTTPLSS